MVSDKKVSGLRFTFGQAEHDVEKGTTTFPITLTYSDQIVTEMTTRLFHAMQRNFALVLLEFRLQENRWPEWAWFEDWREMLDAYAHERIRVPQAYCADEPPILPGGATVYRTGELNENAEKAALFEAELERVLASGETTL